jgi:hypothetical protein
MDCASLLHIEKAGSRSKTKGFVHDCPGQALALDFALDLSDSLALLNSGLKV